MHWSRAIGSAVVTVLLLWLSACNTRKIYFPYTGIGAAISAETRILVEPIMVSGNFPESYDRGILALHRSVRGRLTSAGYTVLSEEETASVLKDNPPFPEEIFNPKTGQVEVVKINAHRTAFLLNLKRTDACDLVVSTGIVVRPAEYLGQTARWDGVIRNVPFDVTNLGLASINMHGHGQGVSVGVRVHDLTGRTVHESFGGVSLVHLVKWNRIPPNTYSMLVRKDALDNPKERAEAVATALHPFVSYEKYPDNPTFSDERSAPPAGSDPRGQSAGVSSPPAPNSSPFPR